MTINAAMQSKLTDAKYPDLIIGKFDKTKFSLSEDGTQEYGIDEQLAIIKEQYKVLFTPYTINRTMELSALIQSGIAENNAEFDELASSPNLTANMPFWNDLTGDLEIMDDVEAVKNIKYVAAHKVNTYI